MKALAAASERWLALCDEAGSTLGANELAPAAKLRRAGREAFAAQGLPATSLEEWRYTNVAELAAIGWRLPAERTPEISRDAIEALASPVFACGLLVFAEGRLVPDLSALRVPEIELLPLAAARTGSARLRLAARDAASGPGRGGSPLLLSRVGSLVDAKKHPFAALATALLDDGILLRLPAGARLEQPLHLVFLSLGGEAKAAAHPRVFVEAGRGSRAVVVQDHVSLGAAPAFTNAVAELHVGPGASLEYVLLQRESDAAFHVSHCAALLERDARLATHTITLGGGFVRNDLVVTLAGEGAEAVLNGLFLGAGERLVDNHTWVDHAVPHGTSRELYKGVLTDRSRGVFRGRVLVRPGAQRTDARQSNPNLLLSEGAEIDSKPQLEIHADDVKCSHGSAIGQSDENALFYLRTRGIDEAAARALLVQGFAAEVLAALPEPALAEALGDFFGARLEGARR
jgi:Fe-S cluster assembly protein SufD